MNGGSWPTKCSSGWSPSPPEAAISAPYQLQMGINSIFPSRFPISQELPVFNDLNSGCSQPRPTELLSPPLPLLCGKYPLFQSSSLDRLNSNNALQVITPVASAHPFLESHGKEVQSQALQSGFSKAVSTGHIQSAYRAKTLDFRAPQKTSINSIYSSWHGDQRLVFCMNTVGELFFADSGHLGVVCFCHRSKMSVAKFCEHSGGISNKAGESVYMENGMTISLWARFFLGVHSIQWDWPNNLHAAVIQSSSLNGSLGRSNNGIVYQNQPHTVGPTTSETPTTLNRSLNEYNSSSSPNCTSAAQKGKISTSIPNNGFRLVSGSANGSNFTRETVILGNSARHREDISSSPLASRFELKLGQPPNLTSNSVKGVAPTSMQLASVMDVQATHFSKPSVNIDFSSNETSGPLQNPRKEDSHLNQLPGNTIPENSNTQNTLTSDDFTVDSTKNSLISLFLSHLERKNPVESGDDIFGNNITDSFRASDEKAPDQCKSGFVRVYDGNSHLSSNLNLSRAGGFLCNVSHAVKGCSPNSETANLKQHNFELMDNSCHKSRRCARFCETAHQHGRMCCLANLKSDNSCNQDDNNKALHEEFVHKSQCANHDDVCKFPVRSMPSCLVCSREQLTACPTCGFDKPPCISNTHENLPTCGACCISRCNKRGTSSLEEGKGHIVRDTNKRPKLSSQCECSWKDVPRNNLLGKDFPKDIPEKFLIREKEISSISSGSSAPAVTEVSVETDRDCEVGTFSMNIPVPVPAEEASLVEKCGSSDEKHEFCTTIQPSLSGTNKSSSLKRERAVMPTYSPAKKLRKNVRLVKGDNKSADLFHNGPVNHSETNKTFSVKNGKDKLLDQAHRGPVGRPGMNETYPEKKRKEKSVYLVHYGPVSHPEMNETFSKKKENLVDQVHHGPVTCSDTTEAFPEKREEISVALVHHRPVSCFEANVTYCEKNREDEVDPVHYGPMNRLEARKQPKYKYLSDIGLKESETKNRNNSNSFCAKRKKPVICGDFGIISNGMTNDSLKPVKIVSLISILRRTKTNSDEILQNEPGKSSLLARDQPELCDLEKSKVKNEVDMVKPTLSRSAPRGKNIKRVKMKSISLDVMEREGMGKSEHSAKSGTGLVQEESNNEIHLDSLLSNSEYQLSPASQGSKPRHAEGHEHLFLSELSCSVCQSSTEEDFNKILQCQHCTITVHQACYGISRLPKDPWFCRPCKAGSFNPVCVLCGYRGGAMTRAQKPRKLVNSLVKYFHELTADENQSMMHWVHMVCGLWNPSTRCPNVNTMAAFDVSQTPLSRKNSICSVCRRPGGSCIKCRVSGCTIVFHPWCAHQKGLLQSEVEGENSEKVGFYGRCIYHGIVNKSDGENFHFEANEKYMSNEDWTCARTEMFRGRKREQYANPTSSTCIITEEQTNAWLRINCQKPCMSDMAVKQLSSSDVEVDLQKEYMRYKQSKGWKNLVVYKSGIHALGLYTSCFIPCGAMVVEYVGEIVGLRVADKREKDYQSGQKLHSKSACYFFRIDKENIIDATRKGGIARFVNRSCSPNCMAKIISVWNEKKVVFIAERDINPGEEITYDYHFNSENAGEKIPCFCNSKNCRRYLN